MMFVFKPLISFKFGQKLTYINRLDELHPVLYLDQIDIPHEVKMSVQCVCVCACACACARARARVCVCVCVCVLVLLIHVVLSGYIPCT